jgi:hypothetical protein
LFTARPFHFVNRILIELGRLPDGRPASIAASFTFTFDDE